MNKYPRATRFLQETGMSLDQALEYFEKLEGVRQDGKNPI